jgi:GC-rich sequence DNA-binding factor
MISKRRQADDEDDLVTFMGSLPTAEKPEPEVDELGSVNPLVKSAAARRNRRLARITRRMRRGTHGQAEDEGYSTDSSLSPSDAADYSTAMQKLAVDGEGILADVKAEDFIDPRLGMVKWFREWRNRYEESYTRAWGGLGLVVVWEFWMRLELLGWDPIDVRSNSWLSL